MGGWLVALLVAVAPAVEVATPDGGHAQNPQWSQDGGWLAFEMNNLRSTVELWVSDVDAGAPGAPSQLKVPGAASTFGGKGAIVADPNWTEKPQPMVIFEGSSAGGVVRLYYAQPGAGAPNELLNSDQISGNLSYPEMGVNGEQLAFVSDASGGGDVYIWSIKANEINPVFQSSSPEHAPAFDEQAQRLVFSRENGGTEDLFTWSGGATIDPLKGGNGDQTRPTWAGERVVYFTSERGDGAWDIAVTGLEPGGGRQVVASGVKLPARSPPSLTPDGQAVAWVSNATDEAGHIRISRIDGSGTAEIDTGLVACGEPSLVQAGGRTWMAFTALPSVGSDWRKLHVIDVTGKY